MKTKITTKAFFCLILVLCCFSLFAKGETESKGPEPVFWIQENEILTYENVDPAKTPLIVARIGNIGIESCLHLFEQQNPDIQIIYLDITGGNSAWNPSYDWITKGLRPDVVFHANMFYSMQENVEQYYQDLSADSILLNYKTEALERIAKDEKVYGLPGPSSINCIVYNTKLFEQYGWEVPKTVDEFIKLCVQIRQDTNGAVEAWNPNAKYSNEINSAINFFVYGECFAGIKNRQWLIDYVNGKASFDPHLQPLFDVFLELVDNDIIREEHFSFSATTRGILFNSSKIAMVNQNVSSVSKGQDFDYGYFAYPGLKENQDYLQDIPGYYISLPITGREEKIQEAAKRFIHFMSKKEAQDFFIGNSIMVSSLKDYEVNESPAFNNLLSVIHDGRLASAVEYSDKGRTVGSQYYWLELLQGKMTVKEAMDKADGAASKDNTISYADTSTILGTAEDDFTILELSEYFADTFKQKTGSEISLVLNNAVLRGNVMLLFAGQKITDSNIAVLRPRSLANGSSLVKASMTGKQLLSALNDPYDNQDCSYAFSGLKCIVAPWNTLGTKMISVTLSDGSDIDVNKLYTVSFWEGTVKEEYITEIVQKYEGNFDSIIKERLIAEPKMLPPVSTERCTLVWN